MKKIVFIVASTILVSCGSSEGVAQKKDYSKADVTKYMKTITSDDLKKHLYIVASDEMEGRNTGSEGQKKAGKYLIEEYKKNKISTKKSLQNIYRKV